jgi:hypothetical protein
LARSKIPNPIERRHLIEKDLSAAQALAIAEAYLEQGRTLEALEFLRVAEAGDRLAELRREAIEAGDAFTLRAIGAAMEQAPRRDDWEALASAASRAGKERYAAEARRQAERGND